MKRSDWLANNLPAKSPNSKEVVNKQARPDGDLIYARHLSEEVRDELSRRRQQEASQARSNSQLSILDSMRMDSDQWRERYVTAILGISARPFSESQLSNADRTDRVTGQPISPEDRLRALDVSNERARRSRSQAVISQEYSTIEDEIRQARERQAEATARAQEDREWLGI